jgi:hypothetical protein
MAARLAARWSQARGWLWRAVYLLSVVSFLLPFVTVVRSCSSPRGEERVFRGYELVAEGKWLLLLLLPIVLACVLFGLSFLRSRGSGLLQGFQSSWRALLAWVAVFTVIASIQVQFLFDKVTGRVGEAVNLACWALVYVAGLAGALITAARLRRLPVSPSPVPRPLARVYALHAGWLILAAAVLPVSAALFFLRAESFDRFLLGSLVLLAIPVGLAQHFLTRGIRGAEPWALARGVLVTPLLLPIGLLAVGVVGAVEDKLTLHAFAAWLVVTAAAGVGALLFSHLAMTRAAGSQR